jgi:methylenetetrahydrofolate dehydrogenase (NADP+)/methenyltetrahydrofolate cyclohydrolase
VVVDVGIHRLDAGGGKTRLVGDVDADAVRSVASALTPVPGGVGPLTVAFLLSNTVDAAERA